MAEVAAAEGDRPNLSSFPSLRSVSVNSSSSFRDVATCFQKMNHDEGSYSYNDSYGAEAVASRCAGEDEAELQWAAIERLPTYRRIRTSLLAAGDGEAGRKKRTAVVDVTKMDDIERRVFIDNLLEKVEEDNLKLLRKLKERIERQANP